MSTTMLTKEQVTRKWYILDAAGKPMGETAVKAADLLRGKLKTDYTPHVDCGDYVIIINAKDAVLTGKKLEQKYYRTHSGYPGGLHETQYKTLMEKKPEKAMELAEDTVRIHLKGDSKMAAQEAPHLRWSRTHPPGPEA